MLIWIVLIAIILITIIFSVIIGLPTDVSRDDHPDIPCTRNISSLPQVTDMTRFQPCFNLAGVQNQSYYDTHNNWTVLPFDRRVAPPEEQICSEFCSQIQLPNKCLTQTQEYNNCVEALSPIRENCTDPARPVARFGSRLYYAIGKGKISCYEQT
jgi:hypothetical protein